MKEKTKTNTAQGAKPATKKNTATKKSQRRELRGWMPFDIGLVELEDGSLALELGAGEEPVFDLREIIGDGDVMEAFEDMCNWGYGCISIPANKARKVRAWMFDWCRKVYRNGKLACRFDED